MSKKKNLRSEYIEKRISSTLTENGLYLRHKTFPVTYQFKWNSSGNIIYRGMTFSASSTKMKILFKQPFCACCGMGGRYWALEKGKGKDSFGKDKPYHFNMYGVELKYGMEIMLTHDHIIPKSQGGGMSLSNAQTMCELCNNSKGDMSNIPIDILKKIRGYLLEMMHVKTLPESKRNELLLQLYSLERKKLSFPYMTEKPSMSLWGIYLKILLIKVKLLFVRG